MIGAYSSTTNPRLQTTLFALHAPSPVLAFLVESVFFEVSLDTAATVLTVTIAARRRGTRPYSSVLFAVISPSPACVLPAFCSGDRITGVPPSVTYTVPSS